MKRHLFFFVTLFLILGAAQYVSAAALESEEEQRERKLGEQLIEHVKNDKWFNAEGLIKEGAPVNYEDKKGETAFELMVYKSSKNYRTGDYRVSQTIVSIIETLVKARKADVNRADKRGNTPLMYASLSNYIYLINLLLEANAFIDVQNKKSESALTRAIACGCDDTVRVLVLAGAKLNLLDGDKNTAWEAKVDPDIYSQGNTIEGKKRAISDVFLLLTRQDRQRMQQDIESSLESARVHTERIREIMTQAVRKRLGIFGAELERLFPSPLVNLIMEYTGERENECPSVHICKKL